MKEYLPYLKVLVLATPFLIFFTDFALKFIVIDQGAATIDQGDVIASFGVLLSAIGVVQLFPLILFENGLLNRVLYFKSSHKFKNSGITLDYEVNTSSSENQDLSTIRYLTILLFVLWIIVFVITVFFSASGEKPWFALTLGAASFIIAWVRLTFV